MSFLEKCPEALSKISILLFMLIFVNIPAFAGEANLVVPKFEGNNYNLLIIGIIISFLSLIWGMVAYGQIKSVKAHKCMIEIGNTIFETCKTYLVQQGKFLIVLEILIAVCIAFYFGFLQEMSIKNVLVILAASVVGILGSYSVAWFGIRMNTLANARTSFIALKNKPLDILNIPLKAGMSIGVLLVSVELIVMLSILLFIPGHLAGACFIGFAIGESLGASALRVAGGIFTKIADIGSDLMKIRFGIKEDDPRNPGVIADCTGDNAGDSIGPTADGFETYGVTGVALVSFILLGVFPEYQIQLLTWIFVMRYLMIITSVIAYGINGIINKILFGSKTNFDFELPLTNLVWITSILSICMTFAVSRCLLGGMPDKLWLTLSVIISCGTLGAALIPEFTKVFTSPKARHTEEVVTASKEGGASLTILSGIVSGNFSGFWIGLVIVALMTMSYFASLHIPSGIMIYSSVFAFGLVAFGFLGMGPVTIAVDSYGPVTDNAQSVYELSLIEEIPNISDEIKNEFGFEPNFETAKKYLEQNDGAGNTFKATSKPVLIGTAVVGATTMIFSLILVIKETLSIEPESILNLLNPYTILGLLMGGAVIYWFSGASMQAVTTGAYRAVEYISGNIKLGECDDKKANIDNSKEVVKICTEYAQKGMLNIFIALFSFALAFACLSAPLVDNLNPVSFFVSYLIGIAIFGLFQAVFMANAGGCWDNAKKIVEVDLNEKGTPLHDATVVGDTVGDPFKDTSSVAMNPIIKFTTLFGLLAMEIAIAPAFKNIAPIAGVILFIIAVFFVVRSFYGMRIPVNNK
ncbi:MAG: sodium-translocating pyrophosphatase [Candidatus Gastranaerophilales bacterium]|nr:sodium-translocating pyrophosphatase [Candidatus Gastranaerophilales bacterium]